MLTMNWTFKKTLPLILGLNFMGLSGCSPYQKSDNAGASTPPSSQVSNPGPKAYDGTELKKYLDSSRKNLAETNSLLDRLESCALIKAEGLNALSCQATLQELKQKVFLNFPTK